MMTAAPKQFDEQIIQNTRTIMKSRFSELIECYLEDSRMYFENIREGLKDNNQTQIMQAAHPLKSSSAGIGMSELSIIAAEVESLTKQAQSDEKHTAVIKGLIKPLEVALEQATQRLQKELEQESQSV